MSEIKSITDNCKMAMKCIPAMPTCPDCIGLDVASSAEILGTIYPSDEEYREGELGWEEGEFPENVKRYIAIKVAEIVTHERNKKK